MLMGWGEEKKPDIFHWLTKLHILWARCSAHGPSMIFETTRQVEADGGSEQLQTPRPAPQDAHAPNMKGWRLGVCKPAL